MTPGELERLLEEISRCRVGIIGDFCLDSYLIIDSSASEVSVETGLPTRPVRERHYSLGGASNVANNLADLGVGRVFVFGVRGEDGEGDLLKRSLEEKKIDTSGLLVQKEGWATHVFTKLYDGDRELERIDFGNFNKLEEPTMESLLDVLERTLPQLDILIINQQVYRGIHTSAFRRGLKNIVTGGKVKRVITDSRSYANEFDGTMRKINDVEGARLCGLKIQATEHVSFAEAGEVAEQLYNRWGTTVFLSRGEYGSLVHDGSGLKEIPALQILSRIDTVGAGDSMLAGIAAALATGASPEQAAALGTLAAGVTIQKLKITGTATPAEILKLRKDGAYSFNPELAQNPEKARYWEGTSIEIVADGGFGGGKSCAIFDNDGTISTLRQGWEKVMEPIMVRSILGSEPDEAEEKLAERIIASVREYIDRTTGVQTLVQMHGLADMVKDFGIAAEEDILQPEEYKEIYNRELLAMVTRRAENVRSGKLAVEEVTMKNAVPFLEELRKRGVTLFLASGTDEEDVRRETELLGYADLFTGGIFGAVGDITVEPKKVVMERILDDLGQKGMESLVTFGDGPVEIRETKKQGGTAVGVASDEINRSGLNEAKRKRLILAGADLIIPDFSDMAAVLALLFKEQP